MSGDRLAELIKKINSLDRHSLVGHEDQLQVLDRGVDERLSAAFILSGASGIGKRKAALQIAEKYLCQNVQMNKSCGQCPSCQQIRAGQSISVSFLAPVDEMIRVDEVQKLLNMIHLRSLTQKRFVIIDDVEKMNLQAANTILKTLEEPPEGLYFFLLTSQISKVLKTIRSRCQVILFHPLHEDQMRSLLPMAEENILEKARGQVGKAQDLTDVDYQSRYIQCQQFLMDFMKDDFLVQDNGWREFVKNRENFLFLMEAWEEILLSRWKSKVLSDESGARVDQMLAGMMKIRRQMRFRPDDTLQIESLWTGLRQSEF